MIRSERKVLYPSKTHLKGVRGPPVPIDTVGVRESFVFLLLGVHGAKKVRSTA